MGQDEDWIHKLEKTIEGNWFGMGHREKTWSATNERRKNLNKVIELWIIVYCILCYMLYV
jgi:hypothetical protein